MNILFYYLERDSFMYKWPRLYILDNLNENGHTTNVFNPLNYNSYEEANDKLIRSIDDNKSPIDLFINFANSDQLFKPTISKIKKQGIPTLQFCSDNLHAPFQHKKIAPLFDLVWLTSKETEPMFKKWGCNTIFLPYAANPEMFKPIFKGEIYGVGFIGRPYGTRVDVINTLTEEKIPCHAYSNFAFYKKQNQQVDNNTNFYDLIKSFYRKSKFKIGRKVILGALKKKLLRSTNQKLTKNEYLVLNPSVGFKKMNTLYSNFAISLGITELRNTYTLKDPVYKLHLRTFEIPMCGGLQLASYSDELATYFEDGKEIILYNSKEEFISKTKFYLKPENKQLRMSMKRRAYRRAKNEHSWMTRFNEVFKELSLKS